MLPTIDTSKWKPVTGDDLPYFTLKLRDAPTGYHITDIAIDNTLIESYSIKDALLDYAERYYKDFEICAPTLLAFKENIQLAYDGNKLVFEEMLKAIKNVQFDKGQMTERVRTYDTNDSGDIEISDDTKNIELAFNSENTDPSNVVNHTGNQGETRTHNETETETTIIDRFQGEDSIDYYQRLMSIYPNIYSKFVEIFSDCFTIKEVIIW